MKRYAYLLLLIACSLLGCEPDDICLAETPGTPQLIIVFYDKANPNTKKEVLDLQVKDMGSDALIHNGTTDSIALPLKTKELSTSFFLTKIENSVSYNETLTLNYDTYDSFISRACGYKTNFTKLVYDPLNSASWIEGVIIVTDSISDIKTTHVKILH